LVSRTVAHDGQLVRVLGIRQISEEEKTQVVKELQETKEKLEAQVSKSTTELKFANERLQAELHVRQQVEQALRESEDRYRRLVEFSPDAIIIQNKGKIDYINLAGVKLLGAAKPEQLIGRRMIDFVHPDSRPVAELRLKEANDGNRATSPIQQKYIRLDGTEVAIEVVEIPFPDRNDPAVQLVVRDITERVKAEVQIAQRNRELTILQAAGVAITSRLDLRYVLDTFAKEMARLVEIESCIIFAWDKAENIVSQLAQYGSEGWWDPKSEAQIYKLTEYPLIKSVLEEQIPEQMTISRPGIDPSQYSYMQQAQLKSLLMLPMVYQRRVLGLVQLEDRRAERTFSHQEISMARLLASQAASAIEHAQLFEQAHQEIRERQLAEAALQEERALLAQRVKERTAELSKANAELARASRLKDEFLAGMSHELRTPLNTILGSSEILQSETFGALNERQAKYARNIEESGRHLLALINDILDISKVEAGKLQLEIGPVSVAAVCEASVRMVKQLAHKKQLDLSTTFNNTVTTLQADERRLKQVLVNLLSNAIKFTPAGGKIGLEVGEDPAREAIYFCVWDTGIGISKEDMDRLFQPFVQLDSSLSRQHAGTGLGLSLVSRMVELHKGGVSVESGVGQGSRFTIFLPYSEPATAVNPVDERKPEASRPVQAALDHWQTGKEKPLILLADDNEDNINMILDYLQEQGYQVIVARSGSEAIARANEDRPDLILMDIQMPEMDGLEATRRLRANPGLLQVPIITLTALAMPGDRERCLEAGANDYLSKPISPRELVKTIERHLS
jgi:PAS domain S-box-containing protein